MKTARGRHALRALLWLLVLCNMAVIWGFSSEPADSSAGTSLRVTETVVRIAVRNYRELQPQEQRRIIAAYHLPVRKMAHGLEFMLLGFLLMMAWARHPVRFSGRIILSFGIALLYALLDELHQQTVLTRGPSLLDAGIDALGAAAGVLLSLAFRSVRSGARDPY